MKIRKIVTWILTWVILFSNFSIPVFATENGIMAEEVDVNECFGHQEEIEGQDNQEIIEGTTEDIGENTTYATTVTLSSSTIASYFNSKVGQSVPQASCLAFIADGFAALGATRSSANCAYEYANSHVMSSSMDNIPIGADVFLNWNSNYKGTKYTCGGHYCHHIAVYVGDGYIVHTSGGVVKKNTLAEVLSWGMDFRGWGYHGNVIIDQNGGGTTTSLLTNQPVTNITNTTARIEAKLPAVTNVSEAGFYFGTSPDNMTKVVENITGKWISFYYTLGDGKWWGALSPGTTYYYRIYVVINGTTHMSAVDSFTTTGSSDKVNPVIHNAYIYHYDANSYTVVVSASDNVGISKVEFPTWYESQEICPVNWYQGVYNSNDGSYYYTVNVSDFGSREGTYHTHVYAWDQAGNAGVYTLAQYIDRTAPTVTEKKAERISDDTVKISCKVSDNTGVVSVYFPTWSDYNGQDDLQSDWETHYKGTKEGDWWVFYVRDYDHNYEKGSFTTHIYPYDAYNNYSSTPVLFSFANQYKPFSFTCGEHSYELYNDLLTWEEAKTKCEELGGHLVTINSQEEQSAIESALNNAGRSDFFIGGQTVNGHPTWITGELFEYTNWSDGEPNNGREGTENVYQIYLNGLWNDCYNSKVGCGFICEYEPDAVIPTDKPGGTIPNGFWIAGVDEAGYTYTGSAIKPQVRVYDQNKRLELNKDYTITYKNNIKVNDASVEKTAPTIIVKGKGNYTKQETVTFKILPKNITDFDIVISNPIRKENRKTQKVVPTITRNGKKLVNKKDFTVEYPDTMAGAYKAPGTYNIVVKGKGGYSGQKTITYTITENVLMSSVSVSKIKDQVYTGSSIKPALTVKKGTTPLVERTDYKVSYSNNKEIGTATVILTGMGKYSGEKKITFKIKGVEISKADVSGVPKEMPYKGSPITASTSGWGAKPKLTITTDGTNKVLTEGTDYTVSYQKNINKGTASIIFTGKNGYSGTLKKSFKIEPYNMFYDLSGKMTVSFDENQVYTKGGSKPKPTVKFGSTTLVEGKDYTLSYKNNNKVNDRRDPNKLPIVTIKGKGNYTASISKSFTIVKQSLANLTISAPDKVYSKTKGAFKSIPKITDLNNKNLSAGTDFEKNYVYTYKHDVTLDNGTVRRAGEVVGATDIVPAGTILRVTVTGKGNYADSSITGEYRITKSSITKATVKVASQTYTGKEITPDKSQITVKIGKQVLTADDYDIVSYSNNIKKGTAKVTIKGKGNYGGTKTVNFTIKSKGFLWWWR